MDDVTREMVDAFQTAWASTPQGEPGARTSAGLGAALNVYAADRNSELARQHNDDPVGLPLFGTVQFVESIARYGDIVHLCRDADGNVLLYGTAFDTSVEVAVMDEEKVRWLAGVLTAALDNWPKRG